MSSQEFSYHHYVSDSEFLAGYHAYQRRYAERIRESDKVLLELVEEVLSRGGTTSYPVRLLDVGCSTGNLLLHLRRAFPQLELVGGDMGIGTVEACRSNPELAGVAFDEMNALDIGHAEAFDFVTFNAVLYLFGSEEFERAIGSACRALRPGGHLLAFDFFHPWEQELEIFESSKTHPDGLKLHFRPQSSCRRVLSAAGFDQVGFRPFHIPIDLPEPVDSTDMGSYTRRMQDDGERLIFRGALFQPWCHLVARKAGAPTG